VLFHNPCYPQTWRGRATNLHIFHRMPHLPAGDPRDLHNSYSPPAPHLPFPSGEVIRSDPDTVSLSVSRYLLSLKVSIPRFAYHGKQTDQFHSQKRIVVHLTNLLRPLRPELQEPPGEIGRASCRERVESS